MNGADEAVAPRLILFHKQRTSARTRFLRFADTVLAFGRLPAEASLRPESAQTIGVHPAAHLRAAEVRLALPAGSLEAIADFRHQVATAGGPVPVLLAAFTSIDPPFAAAEAAGGRFAAITEARDLPAIELELLRHAYEVIIG